LGLGYRYNREVYGPEEQVKPVEGAELTQMGYEYYPDGLGNVIRKVAKVLSIPIMITEHGVATDNDEIWSNRGGSIHSG
jgi:beta-glucosidase